MGGGVGIGIGDWGLGRLTAQSGLGIGQQWIALKEQRACSLPYDHIPSRPGFFYISLQLETQKNHGQFDYR